MANVSEVPDRLPSAVAHLEVESDGDGALIARWELDDPPCEVDVAVGPTPQAVDHVHARSVPAGTDHLRMDGLGPGRHYVSVSAGGGGGAVVAAERRVRFEGVTNFRDLGGYPTAGGGRTRWGMVFRADALNGLNASDLLLYQRLGLRSVYDLRGDVERESRPNPFSSTQLALFGPPRPPRPTPADGPPRPQPSTAEEGEAFLLAVYRRMLRTAGPLFGRLFQGLTDPDGLPVVFHCTNGKDRTGLSAALLLELLGVRREQILDDYELTKLYLKGPGLERTIAALVEGGMGADAATVVMGVPRTVMAQTLDELDQVYGGVESYLRQQAGLSAEELMTLRARLGEPSRTRIQ